MSEEVEVDRFDLSKFTVTIEKIGKKHFLVIRRKIENDCNL